MADEGEDVKPKLNIVIEFEGQTCAIKVKPTMAFQKVFDAAEKRFGKEPKTLKFTFDGVRIRPDQTPAEFNMVEGDAIDAHLEQQGGSVHLVF